MRLPLALENWKRYGEIARLLIKHGRSDFLLHSGLDVPTDLDPGLAGTEPRTAPEAAAAGGKKSSPVASETARAEELADDLERLGPTFIKLGQLLSTRPDLLPPAYVEARSRPQ